ncbi:hypothetical protein [Mesorhizobium sp. f-mel]
MGQHISVLTLDAPVPFEASQYLQPHLQSRDVGNPECAADAEIDVSAVQVAEISQERFKTPRQSEPECRGPMKRPIQKQGQPAISISDNTFDENRIDFGLGLDFFVRIGTKGKEGRAEVLASVALSAAFQRLWARECVTGQTSVAGAKGHAAHME